MPQQNPRLRMAPCDRLEQQRAAIGIRVPGMDEDNRRCAVGIVPNRIVVPAMNRILMQAGMYLDQRRRMKMPPSLQLPDRLPGRIGIDGDVAEKPLGMLPQNHIYFGIASRTIVIAAQSRS